MSQPPDGFACLTYDVRDHVAEITLNCPNGAMR